MFDHVRKLLQQLDPEEAAKHSYINYHAKGLHYLCLHRHFDLTEKLYWIDKGVDYTLDHELVGPHNHSYDFVTTLLRGAVVNYRFQEVEGHTHCRFDYRSPRNGGDGFRKGERVGLVPWSIETYVNPGETYTINSDEIHTIGVLSNTLLHIHQYRDVCNGSYFYSTEEKEPSLDDLYQPMTPADAAHYRDLFLKLLAKQQNTLELHAKGLLHVA